MVNENFEQIDNELIDRCLEALNNLSKKIDMLIFKNEPNVELKKENERRRIRAFKTVIENYSNDKVLANIIPEYNELNEKLLTIISLCLERYLNSNDLSFQKYNFMLNTSAYFITLFRYDIYLKYLEYLQIDYPHQFYRIMEFMKNQANGVQKPDQRELLMNKISELELSINTEVKNIYNISQSANNIKEERDNMSKAFEKIKKGEVKKYDSTFPLSIRKLREKISESEKKIHLSVKIFIENFSSMSLDFEENYIEISHEYLSSFLRKIH